MTKAKRDVRRPYPPDFCSPETLAYRLDISVSSIECHIERGHLPNATSQFGGQPRWEWQKVLDWIAARDSVLSPGGGSGSIGVDPFFEGVTRAAAESGKDHPSSPRSPRS